MCPQCGCKANSSQPVLASERNDRVLKCRALPISERVKKDIDFEKVMSSSSKKRFDMTKLETTFDRTKENCYHLKIRGAQIAES